MGDRSKIEWTDSTWNPVTGCTPISAGCQNCYARRMAYRLSHIPGTGYGHGTDRPAPDFDVKFHPDRLDIPLRWKKPRRIFVCSMGDLFHEDVPEERIAQVWGVMALSPQHTFMLLTKRPKRMRELVHQARKNIWLGVTVEGHETMWRADVLRETPAAVRFISFEPLLADPSPHRSIDFSGIHWIILGGETGPGARYMPANLPQIIRDQCQSEDVPFFFKGWGTYGMKKSDQHYMKIDGREWKEFPK